LPHRIKQREIESEKPGVTAPLRGEPRLVFPLAADSGREQLTGTGTRGTPRHAGAVRNGADF